VKSWSAQWPTCDTIGHHYEPNISGIWPFVVRLKLLRNPIQGTSVIWRATIAGSPQLISYEEVSDWRTPGSSPATSATIVPGTFSFQRGDPLPDTAAKDPVQPLGCSD
jgi:hypothetical protein